MVDKTIDARHALWSVFLRDCQGYRVDGALGKLGFVEDVIFDAHGQAPAALAVRGGLLGRGVSLVPAHDVVGITPRRERLHVRAATR